MDRTNEIASTIRSPAGVLDRRDLLDDLGPKASALVPLAEEGAEYRLCDRSAKRAGRESGCIDSHAATSTSKAGASRLSVYRCRVDDGLSRYLSASEVGDIDGVMSALTDDVEVVSPISGRMVFRGRDDVGVLLGAVYGSLRELRWTDVVGEGEQRVALGRTRIGPVWMTDAMVFELTPDGRIRKISPHLRPWLALTLLALVLGPKVGRRPGVVWRALKS